MKLRIPLILGLIACMAASSCSTTRVLPEGQYRLASNKIVIEDKHSGVSASDVSSYVKQKANTYFLFGWSPMLNIYNWSNPSKDNWINRSLRNVGSAPVVFNPFQVSGSCDNIAKHLEYLGYYNSEVTSRVDTVRRLVKVSYFVKPGKRVRIDSVVFKVPEGEFSDDFQADIANVGVRKGDWLAEKALEAESVRGTSYFRNLGYYSFNKYNYFFTADTLGSSNILTYEIRNYTRNEQGVNAQPLRKFHIGDVSISHSAQIPFRENVLKRVSLIKPGDTYSEQLVNNTYSRLSSLRLFNSVGIEMQPVDSTTVDCHINMGESNQKGFKLALDASTNSSGLLGVSPVISFYNKNLFHGGEWLSLGFSGNFQWQPNTTTRANEFGVSASLSFPRFVGLPYKLFKGANIPRTELQASLNYQNRPEFTRFITNMSYGYLGQEKKLFYQLYPLRVSVIKVDSMTDEFIISLLKNIYLWDSFSDHIDAGVGAQFYYTSDTNLIPKGSYWFARAGVDLSGNVISLFNKWLPVNEYGNKTILGLNYSQYARVEMQLGQCIRFSPGSALAMRLSAGVGNGYGASSSMPFEKEFYVGGASSMRGWQVRALGPGADEMMSLFTIPSQTGDWKIELDLEYRQKLFWKFEGALFAEAGNVWDFPVDLSDILLTDDDPIVNNYTDFWPATIAADWGIGLRLNLDFILIRLDWGIKLYEPSRAEGKRWLSPAEWIGRNGSALHFGVGYPF